MRTEQYRFDEVRLQTSPTEWVVLTPTDFIKMPLAERIQLLVARKLRFLAGGVEISPVEALKD